MDSESLYYDLLAFAESKGFVGTHADELLAQVADSMAEDPRNQ